MHLRMQIHPVVKVALLFRIELIDGRGLAQVEGIVFSLVQVVVPGQPVIEQTRRPIIGFVGLSHLLNPCIQRFLTVDRRIGRAAPLIHNNLVINLNVIQPMRKEELGQAFGIAEGNLGIGRKIRHLPPPGVLHFQPPKPDSRRIGVAGNRQTQRFAAAGIERAGEIAISRR